MQYISLQYHKINAHRYYRFSIIKHIYVYMLYIYIKTYYNNCILKCIYFIVYTLYIGYV